MGCGYTKNLNANHVKVTETENTTSVNEENTEEDSPNIPLEQNSNIIDQFARFREEFQNKPRISSQTTETSDPDNGSTQALQLRNHGDIQIMQNTLDQAEEIINDNNMFVYPANQNIRHFSFTSLDTGLDISEEDIDEMMKQIDRMNSYTLGDEVDYNDEIIEINEHASDPLTISEQDPFAHRRMGNQLTPVFLHLPSDEDSSETESMHSIITMMNPLKGINGMGDDNSRMNG